MDKWIYPPVAGKAAGCRNVIDKDVIRVKSMYIANTAENGGSQSSIYETWRGTAPENNKSGGKTTGTKATKVTQGAGENVSAVAEISDEGKALSRQNDGKRQKSYWEKFLEKKKEQTAMIRMFQKAKSAGKKKASPTNALSKALAIARRIMRGDKVPPKDESFLFRYNSDLYLKAKMMAIQNQKPEKHKSLLDEQKEEGAAGMSHPSHESSASGPAESSGSGEDSDSEGSEE